MNGYHIKASDGTIGHICDFLMDDQAWAIRQLVIKTGHRFCKEGANTNDQGRPSQLGDSEVLVNLTREAVEQSPEHHLASVGTLD